MSDQPPSPNGITTTVEDGAVSLTTSDGRELFHRYSVTREDKWVRLRGPDGSPAEWANFGSVRMGRLEEWCREPDGTERRCSHVAEMMMKEQSNNTLKHLSLWSRFFGLGT